jgi:DNA polymerase-3 subunit gamma/tau
VGEIASQVFYRKWRPQTLAEVVGQEHVTQTLLHALETGRVAHAYLFSGPRGTGKTSTGRILAKALNCQNSGRGEPCNQCQMCQAISQGRALDLIEIDAASNRSIDDIRELRERIGFAPANARYKVYIIDEVHMLTEPASNALLKTLEEPPPHAIFILATTEPHKLLPTILSRCQRFDFHRLSQNAIVSKLTYICQKEAIAIEPAALKLIARRVSGSLRDAENLLEQLVAYYGQQIETYQVKELLGITADSRIRGFAQQILEKDISAGLNLLNSVVADGIDLKQFTRELVEYLREMLFIKSGAEKATDLAPEELAELKELSQKFPLAEILKATQLLSQVDFRSDEFTPLPLELALLEMALPEKEPPLQNYPAEEQFVPSQSEPQSQPSAPLTDSLKNRQIFQGEEAFQPSQAEVAETLTGIEYIQSHWSEFVDTLRGVGSSGNLDAFLRHACEPVAIEDDTLVLAFYYAFHKEKIENPKYRRMVEKKLAEKFGLPNKVRCILTPKAKQQAVNGHLVKAALEIGGRITSVEERNESAN